LLLQYRLLFAFTGVPHCSHNLDMRERYVQHYTPTPKSDRLTRSSDACYLRCRFHGPVIASMIPGVWMFA
jgi:hypothetical protein